MLKYIKKIYKTYSLLEILAEDHFLPYSMNYEIYIFCKINFIFYIKYIYMS